MRKIYLSLLFSLALTWVFAVESLSLNIDDAVKLAKDNNLTLKQEAVKLEGKRLQKDRAYNVFYPTISGTAAISSPHTESTYSYENLALMYSASFNFTPALFDAVTLVKKDYELGRATYDEAERQIELNVKKIFYSLVFMDEQITVLEDTLATVKSRFDLMKLSFKAGLLSELELLQTEVSYHNLKPELNNMINLYNTTLMNFKSLIGIDLHHDVELIGDLIIEEISIDFDEAFEKAIRYNNSLNIIVKSRELIEAQKSSIFSKNFLPVVNIAYSSGTTLADPYILDSYSIDNFSDDIGEFSLSLVYNFTPLLPNSREREELRGYERSIEDVDLQELALLDSIKLQITNLLYTLENSSEIQSGLELTVKLSKRTLEMTEASYERGTSQLLDVDNANNEYNKAQLELLRERISYYNSRLELESLIGEL